MTADAVLTFWFEGAKPRDWFTKNDAFDQKIRDRFLSVSENNARLCRMEALHPWEEDVDKALALILTLDQFPRNMFRHHSKSFAWDPLARTAADRMIGKDWDLRLPEVRRAFVYMPFMHGENLASQNRCLALCESRLSDESTLKHAKAHRQLIQRFGRFPHRNEVLGRVSTPEELEFLKSGGYAP